MSSEYREEDIEFVLQRIRDISNDPRTYLDNIPDSSIIHLARQLNDTLNEIDLLPDRDDLGEPFDTVYNSFRDLTQQVGRIIQESRNLPADREDVERLTQIIISASHVNAESVCSICTELFQVGENARQMPCHEAHIFHTGCLLPWLERRNSCPICRTRLLRLTTATSTL
ncbi:E3 ubiquitin-protein ligase RDUF1-like [Cryptomeria japonica]|uniref:E3 ubiquitin-protein ligase RDUF1-like n=1 Tax=Cryptomeria japonica TaxID=3369 RepID=UPI0027DAAC45|nr:E3 ubiquitin-protein ligase RDUF1-like [Cryptomeria japonica]